MLHVSHVLQGLHWFHVHWSTFPFRGNGVISVLLFTHSVVSGFTQQDVESGPILTHHAISDLIVSHIFNSILSIIGRVMSEVEHVLLFYLDKSTQIQYSNVCMVMYGLKTYKHIFNSIYGGNSRNSHIGP